MVKIFVGWDQRDALAYRVCEASILEHASIPVEVIPLKDWELRQRGCYWRSYRVDDKGQMWDDRDGKPFSTNFSFTRFCVPWLSDYKDELVVFCDPDMLWMADVAELLTCINKDKAISCVKHDHRPKEPVKMDGVLQTVYARKNWSSLMVLNPSKCKSLTSYAVNNQTGSWLHSLCWVPDEDIWDLSESWNWLEGWSSPDLSPKVIHYTRGTPDMDPNVDHADPWWETAAKLGDSNG
jgi:hypothetical protein